MRLLGSILMFAFASTQAFAGSNVVERFGLEARKAPASAPLRTLVDLFRAKLAGQESENAFVVVETFAVTRDFGQFVSDRQLLGALNGTIDSLHFKLELARAKKPFALESGVLVIEQFKVLDCTDHKGAIRAAQRVLPDPEYVELDKSVMDELESAASFLATDCDLSTALVRLSHNDAVVDALVFADARTQEVTLLGMGANP